MYLIGKVIGLALKYPFFTIERENEKVRKVLHKKGYIYLELTTALRERERKRDRDMLHRKDYWSNSLKYLYDNHMGGCTS